MFCKYRLLGAQKKALELLYSKKVVVHRRVVHPSLGGDVGPLVKKIPGDEEENKI